MQETETHKLDWQGRKFEIAYQPHSFAGRAHLQIRVKHCRPLPITETGYRSHFAHPVDVEELGGPAGYVEAWLDAMAQTKAWRRTAGCSWLCSDACKADRAIPPGQFFFPVAGLAFR